MCVFIYMYLYIPQFYLYLSYNPLTTCNAPGKCPGTAPTGTAKLMGTVSDPLREEACEPEIWALPSYKYA